MLTVIARYICGINPTQAAWKTFDIAPYPVIKECSIEVPTVKGSVELAYDDDDNRFACTISVPCGTTATFILPQTVYTKIVKNGKTIRPKAEYKLKAGKYTFTCHKK